MSEQKRSEASIARRVGVGARRAGRAWIAEKLDNPFYGSSVLRNINSAVATIEGVIGFLPYGIMAIALAGAGNSGITNLDFSINLPFPGWVPFAVGGGLCLDAIRRFRKINKFDDINNDRWSF